MAGTTSFQDFQASVSDAWDIEDDDFSIISGLESKGVLETNNTIKSPYD